jgi:hypothetical protein
MARSWIWRLTRVIKRVPKENGEGRSFVLLEKDPRIHMAGGRVPSRLTFEDLGARSSMAWNTTEALTDDIAHLMTYSNGMWT